ncbi:MAG: rod shape-determining protein [Clostridia bacterium]|nr:rod shape-determining protein [Clostridia bacterium]
MRWDIGIDLGTQNARMAELKEGATMDVPAALAFREGRVAPICAGEIAQRLIGRTCEGVSVHRPLRDGVLENNFYAEQLLRWMFQKSESFKRRRHCNVIVTCQPFSRPVQREALMNAAIEAGAAEVLLVRADVATALGAGLDIQSPEARLLVDVGAGKISATLFTFGRVAAYGYLPYGLNRIDERIQRIMRTDFGYRIGWSAAVEIKHTLGSAMPDKAPKDIIMHMTGMSMAERLPVNFDVETQPVLDACDDVVKEIVRMCAAVVESAPEELAADLNDVGLVLAGGGAAMTELDRRLGQALGIPCRVADAPATCAVRGLQRILEDPAPWSGMMQGRQARTVWR